MDEIIKNYWNSLKQDLKAFWDNNKLTFIFGAFIALVIFFRNILIDLVIDSSRRLMQKTNKEDQQLSSEADKANNEANKLVEQAKKEESKTPNVDEDWYKK